MAVTGLFAMVATAASGVLASKGSFCILSVRSRLFFIMGVFILATALLKSGLSARLALHLLKSGSKSPKRWCCISCFTSALLSFVMSEHAVAAMCSQLVVIISDVA
jgi:sodium-dependent dicarboxylate transporter 2/3/5